MFMLNTLLTVHEALFISFFFKLNKYSNNNLGFFKIPSGTFLIAEENDVFLNKKTIC